MMAKKYAKWLIEFFNWIENMNVNEDTVLSDARCDGWDLFWLLGAILHCFWV